MPRRPLLSDDFWRVKTVSDPQLSPDGQRTAYVVGTLDRETDETRSAIWVLETATGKTQQFTGGTAEDRDPRWSPDACWLAFTSTRGDRRPAIYVMPANGGEAQSVSSREEAAYSPTWAPDSYRLAWLQDCRVDRQRRPEELAWIAQREPEHKEDPQLRHVRDLQYRWDGVGYFDTRSHLFLGDRVGGPVRQLTDGDAADRDIVWSPVDSTIAFVSRRLEDADHSAAEDMWVVDADTGQMRCLTEGNLTADTPRWSPDGHTIAFYAAPEWFAFGTRNTHLWAVSISGGDARDLIPDFDRTIGALLGDYASPGSVAPVWSPDGQMIYFTVSDLGCESLVRVSADGGPVHPVSRADVHIAGACMMPDGSTLVCCAATPTVPFDLFHLPAQGGDLHRLTDTNAELLAETEIFPVERFAFRSIDDRAMQGWFVQPHGDGPFPLVLHVHGGPHSMYGATFYYNMHVLAGAGIASAYINPRGSAGYGQQFMQEVCGDWGGKDFQDLMNGLDHLVSSGLADGDRMAITGGSYGGFMTNWALGHTDRFRCGVAVNSLSNLVSFWGTSDIGSMWFDQQLGGTPWELPDLYHTLSPLTYAPDIDTPLLLIHAENDHRVPIEQGEQMYMALKKRRCTVEMIRIPVASHALASTSLPRHRIARWVLAREWFDRYLLDADEPPIDSASPPETLQHS